MTPWQHEVGDPPYRVRVFENLRKEGVLYLRWRTGNWKHRSLKKKLRAGNGRIVKERERWAKAQANAHHEHLIRESEQAEERKNNPLTISQGFARTCDPDVGKYPVDTPHRREVLRAGRDAERILGGDTAWEDLTPADVRKLGRIRLRELQTQGNRGVRGGEVSVARLLAVSQWLKDEQFIPHHACVPPKHWKQELARYWSEQSGREVEYEPERPRHTNEELRAILDVAHQVDPRFDLAVNLFAEYRLGQGVRARRSDLDLDEGTILIRGRGKKRGEKVYLTEGQMTAVYAGLSGYLAELEETSVDYPLFPSGQLTGGRSGNPHAVERHRYAKPIGNRRLHDWLYEAEALAGIEHVEGRGWYGLRRQGTDGALDHGISEEGLQRHGGWSSTQIPREIYADQQAKRGRLEAMAIRAKIRGEDGE